MPVELKEGEGKLKVDIHCAICHSNDYIPLQPKLSRTQWSSTVTKMIKIFGAQLSQEDADAIASYLTVNYGTEK
jgi:mono/diheme cytochrome c family protein